MYYVLDEKGNRQEGLTKEEILSVLQQAIDNGSLAGIEKDSAFVSKLKCCVGGETFQMAFVTQAKYNELFNNNQLTENTFYFITDDPTEENIEANIETLATEINAINEVLGGINGTVFSRKKLLAKNEILSNTIELPVEVSSLKKIEIIYTINDDNDIIYSSVFEMADNIGNGVYIGATPVHSSYIDYVLYFVYGKFAKSGKTISVGGDKIKIVDSSKTTANELFNIIAVYEIIE